MSTMDFRLSGEQAMFHRTPWIRGFMAFQLVRQARELERACLA